MKNSGYRASRIGRNKLVVGLGYGRGKRKRPQMQGLVMLGSNDRLYVRY